MTQTAALTAQQTAILPAATIRKMFLDFFRVGRDFQRNVEHIKVEFVNFLFAEVGKIILRSDGGIDGELVNAAQIIQIIRRNRDFLSGEPSARSAQSA